MGLREYWAIDGLSHRFSNYDDAKKFLNEKKAIEGSDFKITHWREVPKHSLGPDTDPIEKALVYGENGELA